MAETLIRKHFGTTKWEVIERYGFHETLIAIKDTKQEAIDYGKIRSSILREPFMGIIQDTDV